MHINNLKYAGIDIPQINAGKKHMLYIEMEILTALKKYEVYKKLRKEEFAVKNLLKKTVVQLNEEMKILDNLLPQMPKEPHAFQEDPRKQVIKIPVTKRDIIEEQIEELQRKIANLQN